jgi:D-alanine transfer protein
MNSFLQAPHLVSMFMALGLASSVLIGFDRYATGVENRYVRALSPLMFIQKGQGRALQRAAFQRHDLLPVYGSSELLNQRAYQRPYNAKVLLEAFPTGFTIFPIGKAETSDLIFLQKLAAVGGSARGKKVVISLTPVWFFNRGEMMDPDSYGGNFSRLQAYELAFSGELSLDVKRRAARRMLDYPGTLASDPLLRFALDSLADFTPAGRCRYALAFPLGKLQTVVFGLQDHWEVLGYIQGRPGLKSSVAQRIADPDWPALKARAIELYREHSSNNPFGFDNDRWLDGYRQKAAEQQA